MERPQLVVHISGSPGSGKTTLGEEISHLYGKGVVVKDTDDFAIGIPQNVASQFLATLRTRIVHFIGQHKGQPVVLLGILDVTIGEMTDMVDLSIIAQHRLFLDVPLPQLLRQFYARIIMVGVEDPQLWEEVASGRHAIPSSADKISDATHTRTMHENAGYAIMSREQILTKLKSLLCSGCGSTAINVKCISCERIFCGNECALQAAQSLRYRDTNYIFGTKRDFTLWRESRVLSSTKGEPYSIIDADKVEHIFGLVDMSKFHKETAEDRPQCCDHPYRVIEYGGRGHWVASMDNVPELAAALLQLYAEPVVIHRSKMRLPSAMK